MSVRAGSDVLVLLLLNFFDFVPKSLIQSLRHSKAMNCHDPRAHHEEFQDGLSFGLISPIQEEEKLAQVVQAQHHG